MKRKSSVDIGAKDFEPLFEQLKMFDFAVRTPGQSLYHDSLRALLNVIGNPPIEQLMDLIENNQQARLTFEQTMLAMALKPTASYFEIKKEAAKLINNTQVNYVPHQPPGIMRRAGLVAAARIDKGGTLIDDIISIGWYIYEEQYGVIVQTRPDRNYPNGNLLFFTFNPRWSGESLPTDNDIENNPLLTDVEAAGLMIGAKALRFLIVLGILMGAEQTPLREEIAPVKRGTPKGNTKPTAWVTRHVYLSEQRPLKDYISPSEMEQAIREGLTLEQVEVRGHIRRQRHGPGNSLVKEIYVRGFLSHRWISPDQNRRVIVH